MKYEASYKVIKLGYHFESKLKKQADLSDIGHLFLDIAGFVPVVGELI